MLNECGVGIDGLGHVVILMPKRIMTVSEARECAAWLLVMASMADREACWEEHMVKFMERVNEARES